MTGVRRARWRGSMPRRDASCGFAVRSTRKRLQPFQAAFMQITKLAHKSQSILIPAVGMRVVNLRGQAVQLLMKSLDGLNGGRHSARGLSLRLDPRTQAAWIPHRAPAASAACPAGTPENAHTRRGVRRWRTAPRDCSRPPQALPSTADRRAMWPPMRAIPVRAWASQFRIPARNRIPAAAASGRGPPSPLPPQSPCGGMPRPIPECLSGWSGSPASSGISRTKLWSIFRTSAGRRFK